MYNIKTVNLGKLRDTRVAHKHRQEDIANLLKIQQPAYSKKENGDIDFTLTEVEILANHYKMSVDDLFFD